MKSYLDTANIKEIREAASLSLLDGVTTNRSLVAKEGRGYVVQYRKGESIMATRLLPLRMCAALGIMSALGIVSGCATNNPDPAARTSDSAIAKQAASSKRDSDRMFYWREEARELQEIAERREREADLLSARAQGTGVNEVVARMRSRAKQLRAAAEYAEEQAQEAQRLVPQSMEQ